MTDAPELLPCPLCGETLEVRTGRNPYGRHSKDSECLLAQHAVNIPFDVERWNRRAQGGEAIGYVTARGLADLKAWFSASVVAVGDEQFNREVYDAVPAAEPMARETGWLIELKPSVVATPVWFQLVPDDDWTSDASKALRFARKQDAEAHIASVGWTEAFASEHEWSDPSPKYLAKVASLPERS